MRIFSHTQVTVPLAACLLAFCAGARAASSPEDLVANAECIALVESDLTPSLGPAPKGKIHVRVKEIWKGVSTSQTFVLPENTLKSGETALLLFPFRSPVESELALRPERNSPPSPRIWPLGAEGTIEARGIQTNLAAVKEAIAKHTPEEVGLNAQVIDALLFPKKQAALAKKDSARGNYISLVIALRDLDRNKPAIEALLLSPDENVRAAAEAKLKTLQTAETPNRWPNAVPETLKAPDTAFPEPLVNALEEKNIAAFAKDFPAWLDSGVMRDREMRFAESLPPAVAAACNLDGLLGKGAYPPPAPRLPQDFTIDEKIPAPDRMKALALLAEYWNYDRFVAERVKAIAEIQAAKPGDEMVRRAVFWDPRNGDIPITVGATALRKLPVDTTPEAVALLQAAFFSDLNQETLGAARMAVHADNKPFIDVLVERAKASHDESTTWGARLLCQEGRAEALPLMLGWLQDSDAEVRTNAAFNLCWTPRPEIVEPLLKLLGTEQDPRARRGLLTALAMTGDPRTLDVLLVAAKPGEPFANADVARGLARIGDPKALPVLAALAESLSTGNSNGGNPRRGRGQPMETLGAVVNAFGYISKLYPAHELEGFWQGSAVNEQEVKDGLVRIRQWSAEQQKSTPAPATLAPK